MTPDPWLVVGGLLLAWITLGIVVTFIDEYREERRHARTLADLQRGES